MAKVKIHAGEYFVQVDVGEEEAYYGTPGMLTGCDLRDVLALCGIEAEYTYEEGQEEAEEEEV
jgi:hypothetical protein